MTKQKKHEPSSSSHHHYTAIVAIVAVVAIVILVMNSMQTSTSEVTVEDVEAELDQLSDEELVELAEELENPDNTLAGKAGYKGKMYVGKMYSQSSVNTKKYAITKSFVKRGFSNMGDDVEKAGMFDAMGKYYICFGQVCKAKKI